MKYRPFLPLSFSPSSLFFFFPFSFSFFVQLWAKKNNRTNSWFPWIVVWTTPKAPIRHTNHRIYVYPELSTGGLHAYNIIIILIISLGYSLDCAHSLAFHSLTVSLVFTSSLSLFLFRSLFFFFFSVRRAQIIVSLILYNIYIYVYVPRVSRQIRDRLIFFFFLFFFFSLL